MGRALVLASLAFIVLGTYYGGQRQASEIETRKSVSGSQYESIARNGALTGVNRSRQSLSECFASGLTEGISGGARFMAETIVSGDFATITSFGSIMGAKDKEIGYTVVTHMERLRRGVPFKIVDLETIPEGPYRVETKVIGSEISYGGAYRMPVTLRLDIGGASYEPFGKYDSQNHGVDNRPSFMPDETFAADTPISISAKSWMKGGPGGWKVYMEQDSRAGDNQLVVLRDGDKVPKVAGMSGQVSAGELLAPFTENGKIKLNDNQAIYLFELGSKDPSSTAFDLQDMVVLIDLYQAGGKDKGKGKDKDKDKKAKKGSVTECGGYDLRMRHYNES